MGVSILPLQERKSFMLTDRRSDDEEPHFIGNRLRLSDLHCIFQCSNVTAFCFAGFHASFFRSTGFLLYIDNSK
jgi:hypothetical protein